MLTKKLIREESSRLTSLYSLVEVYESIAASTVRKIRSGVLESRNFQQGLKNIFAEIKQAISRKEVLAKRVKKEPEPSTPLVVLLSANVGLYGEIVARTFELFKNQIRTFPDADVAIIGKIGKANFEETFPQKKFLYLDFPDAYVDFERLAGMIKIFSEYKKIVVYHGLFKSLLDQTPIAFDVFGAESEQQKPAGPATTFLFEPSLEEIASFFEKEIFASLVEQTFHESLLARAAGRLVLLDRAHSNVGEFIKKISIQRKKVDHMIFNKKQVGLNAYAVLLEEEIIA